MDPMASDSGSIERLLRQRLFPRPGQLFWVGRTEVRGHHAPHDHDFFEIVVAAGGKGEHQTVNGAQSLGSGDVLILRPGAWHAYHRCQRLVLYNCCFAAELLDRQLLWLMEDPTASRLLWAGPLHPARQGALLTHLKGPQRQRCLRELHLMASRRQRQALEQMGDLLKLLGLIAPPQSAPDSPTDEMHPAVSKAAHLLARDYRRPWSLEELASSVGLNRSYLVRLFRRHAGVPPLTLLSRIRLERAASLLLCGHTPIGQIAGQVGWEDQNYFARRFRAHFGVTPSEYRERHRQKTWPQGA